MDKIKIVIVDDHRIIREGLIALLEEEKNFDIIADYDNEQDLYKFLESNKADIILLDVSIGSISGINVARKLKIDFQSIPILAISMHKENSYITGMIEAGASGYILKDSAKSEIITAIQAVANGNTYFSKDVSETLFYGLRQGILKNEKIEAKKQELSEREIEIIKHMSHELSNQEIADKLFISIRTVDAHKRNIIEKLGVKNSIGVVKYAIKNNLIELD